MFFSAGKPDWETDGRDWPQRAHSRFIEAGGLNWHVQDYGAGPTLLLLHGTGAATHSWGALGELLRSDFRIVAPDLPGHGFSATPRAASMSLPGMAKAVGALLAAIGAEPRMAAGHSAGAAILVRMIRDGIIAPEAAISVNGAFLPFAGAGGFVFPAMAKLLALNPFVPGFFAQGARARSRVESLIRGTGSQIPDENVDRYARLLGRPGHVHGALAMMAAWDLSATRRDLAAITTPFVFATGAADRAVPPSDSREAARLAKAGAHLDHQGLGHLAHEERPDIFAALARRLARDHGIL